MNEELKVEESDVFIGSRLEFGLPIGTYDEAILARKAGRVLLYQGEFTEPCANDLGDDYFNGVAVSERKFHKSLRTKIFFKKGYGIWGPGGEPPGEEFNYE